MRLIKIVSKIIQINKEHVIASDSVAISARRVTNRLFYAEIASLPLAMTA